MTKKPFPFSVCEQCCGSGDVSPEQIEEAVKEYLEKNPITGTEEIYVVEVEQLADGSYRLNKGSYHDIKYAYDNKKAAMLFDITLRHCAMLWKVSDLDVTFCCNTAARNHMYDISAGGSVYSNIMTIASIQEVDNRINAAIGEALEGDY